MRTVSMTPSSVSSVYLRNGSMALGVRAIARKAGRRVRFGRLEGPVDAGRRVRGSAPADAQRNQLARSPMAMSASSASSSGSAAPEEPRRRPSEERLEERPFVLAGSHVHFGA